MADPKNQRKHIYGKLKVPKQFWDIMTPFEDSAVVDPTRRQTGRQRSQPCIELLKHNAAAAAAAAAGKPNTCRARTFDPSQFGLKHNDNIVWIEGLRKWLAKKRTRKDMKTLLIWNPPYHKAISTNSEEREVEVGGFHPLGATRS
ncbi:hypothetical protein GE21DRAFT_3857 [Neurospora crassa]|uniref:Uncharacterized protein n=1 Tax=Neurospora crassa (strain ATCC 24698 / 74-OR23-1A / CBS 708.71 / DSM 1257 / FGSC 987) TaxID=367110 RepID=U9W7Y6_NEUCR|nr:hypothetical protein NCU16614 [Neurospora crassa OR74A]ESA43125.1 hypothetical protein NCU16614 [Neurospora crassa OR74A]KHE78339.1 hypothetical protein GE21DRAFT_3857 [Neurospora crassa]|eukprot:XP_011394014.1 hypothetical protein NCU16614 [Neurospora crassa OR74A]